MLQPNKLSIAKKIEKQYPDLQIIAGNIVTALYAQAGALAKLIRTGDMTWHHNSFANAVSERGVGIGDTTLIPATTST